MDVTTAPDASGAAAVGRDDVDPGRPDLARGSQIGRYVVLDRLGAGAMGVVLAAFDPELDRKVAIKLLKSGAAGPSLSASSDARARLVREAQALAKLSHPNVVGIFDAGTHGEDVWIAMELVVGRTLRTWLAERRPDWREVLAVMTGAGRGLAAAHAAGLVHRDVKPDNVMIGEDGRVRVMDFGLARRGAERGAGPVPGVSAGAMLSAEVTHAGAMVGTPAYMAPEQFRGQAVGPPADVFAFCVMVWEGIHGARPFAGATVEELAANVAASRVMAPLKGSRAPGWLHAALLRGLAAAPERRWQDMGEVLAAFERGQARSRRGRALALAGGLAAGAGAVYGGLAMAHERALAGCEGEGAAIVADWSPEVRDALRRAFMATGKANAATVFEKTAPWLDRWAAAWQAARTGSCVAHRVEGTLDDELHARAEDCFDELRGSFGALVREFGEADAPMLTRATVAAASLAPVEGCTDPATLRERPLLSPEREETVRAIRGQLARVASMQAAGRYKPGLAVAKAAVDAARAADWPPVVAEAELRVGSLESLLGEHVAAEHSLLRALAAAREARAPRPALASMTLLVFIVGDRASRFAEGKVWAEAARTELMHVAGDVRPMQAQVDLNLALVHAAQGAHDEAQRLDEQALALWTEAYGEDHPQVAQTLNNLAIVYSAKGTYEEAMRLQERALAIRERALGEDHPQVAASLNSIAVLLEKQGRAAEALEVHRRVLTIRERVFDEGHLDLVETLINLANVRLGLGERDEALGLYGRALAGVETTPGGNPRLSATILYNRGRLLALQRRDAEAAADHARSLELFEAALGKDNPTLGYPLDGLAGVRLRMGEIDEAQRLLERALAIREAALGKDHPELFSNLVGLASVQRRRGGFEEALRLDTRALAVLEAKTPENPLLAQAFGGLGKSLLALGRPAEAIVPLERGLPLAESNAEDPLMHAELRFLLARALWGGGGDRSRARGLAERAAEVYAAAPGSEKELAEVQAWLARPR